MLRLNKRTLLMAATGLLIGYAAAAQPTGAATANSATHELLFWVLLGVVGIVLLLVLMTGAMMGTQLRAPLRPAEAKTESETTNAERGVPAC